MSEKGTVAFGFFGVVARKGYPPGQRQPNHTRMELPIAGAPELFEDLRSAGYRIVVFHGGSVESAEQALGDLGVEAEDRFFQLRSVGKRRAFFRLTQEDNLIAYVGATHYDVSDAHACHKPVILFQSNDVGPALAKIGAKSLEYVADELNAPIAVGFDELRERVKELGMEFGSEAGDRLAASDEPPPYLSHTSRANEAVDLAEFLI